MEHDVLTAPLCCRGVGGLDRGEFARDAAVQWIAFLGLKVRTPWPAVELAAPRVDRIVGVAAAPRPVMLRYGSIGLRALPGHEELGHPRPKRLAILKASRTSEGVPVRLKRHGGYGSESEHSPEGLQKARRPWIPLKSETRPTVLQQDRGWRSPDLRVECGEEVQNAWVTGTKRHERDPTAPPPLYLPSREVRCSLRRASCRVEP